ncbi:apyrase [Megalopta genalis]|uniref:apyrase n=1 Tax=Megalopta genalis TaxID=115081 RepID=UPI003FD6B672
MHPIWLLMILFRVSNGFTGRGLHYPGRSDLFELSVIHLNDFHARFEETIHRSSEHYTEEETVAVGGIARVSTVVNRLIEERPNPIFLNAGDNFQGTIWYNVHRWNVTATFMNMLPHDVLTLGNHEFDDGVDGVVPFLKNLEAPVAVANIDAGLEPSMQGLYKNSTVIVRNGTKIGVIGVILSTTSTIAVTGRLKFLDEVETVNAEASRLKSRGVDIIVVLSHCGLYVDRIMARKCPLIDLIVGGHSHTLLYSGQLPNNDQPEDVYPVVVTQAKTNRTVLIVQAAAFTRYLGNLTVWFDEHGEVADWDGNPIFLDSSVEQDPAMVKALEPWKATVDEAAKRKIAKSRVYLDSRCRRQECNLGNLITDAMVAGYAGKAKNRTFWTHAAVACMNPGGIRAPIETGEITFSDLIMAQPFENTWDTIELKGSCIMDILNSNGILVWSGLKLTYKMTGGTRKVSEVLVRCQACEMPMFEKLVEDRWYRLVVPTFLIGAGDGYTPFKTCGRYHEVGEVDTDVLIRYMRKISPITVGLDRRLVFIDDNSV